MRGMSEEQYDELIDRAYDDHVDKILFQEDDYEQFSRSESGEEIRDDKQ